MKLLSFKLFLFYHAMVVHTFVPSGQVQVTVFHEMGLYTGFCSQFLPVHVFFPFVTVASSYILLWTSSIMRF